MFRSLTARIPSQYCIIFPILNSLKQNPNFTCKTHNLVVCIVNLLNGSESVFVCLPVHGKFSIFILLFIHTFISVNKTWFNCFFSSCPTPFLSRSCWLKSCASRRSSALVTPSTAPRTCPGSAHLAGTSSCLPNLLCLRTEPQGLLWHSPEERIGKSIIMSSRTLLQCFLTGKDIFRIVMWLKDLVNHLLGTMWGQCWKLHLFMDREPQRLLWLIHQKENW